MTATADLRALGQSLWVDNITRAMLETGTLQRYIDHYAVTGLTSNPSIFQKAMAGGEYDEALSELARGGHEGEDLVFGAMIPELQRAADLFLGVWNRTDELDGYVSLEVSPELAYDTTATVEAAKRLHAWADRPNLFIKIPGTPEGLPAIEETIAAGIPVNVTLLFDADQLMASQEAYLRGIERRVAEGRTAYVPSVASLFMSRWDGAIDGKVPAELEGTLALAIGGQAYKAYRDLLAGQRMQGLMGQGARPQRLLWASTSTKSKALPEDLYVAGLAAPMTVNTMPDTTLEAYYERGSAPRLMSPDGGDFVAQLKKFADAGLDVKNLALTLQSDGAKSFVDAWTGLREQAEATAAKVS